MQPAEGLNESKYPLLRSLQAIQDIVLYDYFDAGARAREVEELQKANASLFRELSVSHSLETWEIVTSMLPFLPNRASFPRFVCLIASSLLASADRVARSLLRGRRRNDAASQRAGGDLQRIARQRVRSPCDAHCVLHEFTPRRGARDRVVSRRGEADRGHDGDLDDVERGAAQHERRAAQSHRGARAEAHGDESQRAEPTEGEQGERGGNAGLCVAAAERRCGEEAAGGDGRDASTPGGEFCGLAFVCAANLPQSQRCARLPAICRHAAAVEDRLHDAERGAAAS